MKLGGFRFYYVTHVKREINSAVHILAKATLKKVLNSVWL
jgi:hypothetical protein